MKFNKKKTLKFDLNFKKLAINVFTFLPFF